MENIPKDVFINLLSLLDKNSITALKTNTILNSAIKEATKTNIFWKKQIETLLGIYSNYVFSNWRQVYNNLIKDFSENISFENALNALNKASTVYAYAC